MKKCFLLLMLLCAALLLCGCASEQTIVRKVNEPMSLHDTEQLKPAATPMEGAQLLDLAMDNQTALLLKDGQLQAWRDGKAHALALEIPALENASEQIAWSPNCRYACWVSNLGGIVIDMESGRTESLGAVLTACFNADQTTLFFTRAAENGSVLYRRKVFSGSEDKVLDVPYTVHGEMFRTTRSQYLVMGDQCLLCLEQDEKGRSWSVRLVADFGPSGMTLDHFSYRAQTGLCIVDGFTADGCGAFSVVSPDGKDFVIDQVTCFTPLNTQSPAFNLPAAELTSLADPAAFPFILRHAQLSPGGLYLLLFGTDVSTGFNDLYLFNLDKGGLTHVTLPEPLLSPTFTRADWCSGKWLLLATPTGDTALYALTGWDD